jgi:hypothetical protein
VNESVTRFGPDGRLAGIVTEPSAGAGRRGCILVSAGLVPKAGPYRLYVELARRLAEDGIVTLRFDLGGIGESARGAASLTLRQRTELEIGAALEHLLSRFALDGVTLAGLCSGAEDSLRSADLDPRVSDVVMIDPFAYRARGFWWRHLRHRVGRRTLRAFGIHEPLERDGAAHVVRYRYLTQPEASAILARLLARATRVHFVYTAGVREAFNHPSELAASFPELDFQGLVTVDYFAHIDHTQLLAEDRRTLVEAVARRLTGAS